MDFLSNLASGGQSKPNSDQPGNSDHHDKPSNSDLLASARVVADAAQAQFRNEPEKYDKGKVAGAAADILGAGSEYAKLDETKGIGKYVDQAEGYLRQYNTSGHQKTVPNATAENPSGGGAGDYIKKAEEFVNKPSGGGAEGGGAGDCVKKAEEFLNKPSSDGGKKSEASSQSEGGYGDLLKAAGGFLNK